MVWALLQFALPTIASYADALLERAGADVASHVESGSGTSCVPVHPADCALCQAVQRTGMTPPAVCVPLVSHAAPVPPRAATRLTTVAERGRLPLSRAPPAV